ncbi:GTP-binding protein [Paraburkholderia sp. CNPSo 3076]|uniref:CobW family GTP-binding protein n=1 Tax=Paraburkholderia sp. CNPSo 3076 TaxID=2940936 RepID=UPI0022585500|nr:CobW family GTP-binding protein [Paraburkholderia sp. CNPSo 3076]MCX5543126.1 GTP-binding protein [Paraburkholderia sp. CNPSo 3076]
MNSAATPPTVRAPIDLAVIGGYLGAGKTTVVNHLLEAPHGKRIAVLVNDFGAVNIDGRLVRARSDDVIELDNGCICCTIGGALVDALARLAAREDRPDLLLIEASGVSDPAKIAQVGLLNSAFRLTAVLVVVDAPELVRTLVDPLVGAMAQQQIDSANAVIVAKLDLIAPESRERAVSDVRALAATDIVVAADHGRVPLALLFDASVPQTRALADAGRWQHRPLGQGASVFPTFASVALAAPGVLEKGRLRAWLKALPRTILRAKGFVRVVDAEGRVSTRVCQVAGRRLRMTPPAQGEHTPGAESVIVFIGFIDPETEAMLRDGLLACCVRAAA